MKLSLVFLERFEKFKGIELEIQNKEITSSFLKMEKYFCLLPM
jgi:hypothetical protein